MKGNLAEQANCCAHHQWWREAMLAGRKPFALPGTPKRYAPDLPVRVHHLKLVLDVEPEQRFMSGTAYTTVEPIANALTELFFQAEDLKILRVSVAGGAQDLDFDSDETGFTVKLSRPLRPGEKLEVAVAYEVSDPKAGIYFTGPTPLYPNKPYQVWTQGQDEDSHYWYPVAAADYPNHKMTSEVVCTVPAAYTALSNGKLVMERSEPGGAKKTYHWLHDKMHVPYLVTLVVGVFAKLQESFEDIPVECWVDPALVEPARAYFKGTAQLVALFSRLYGVRYPWPGKYAQVFVQDFIFGGMENTTLSTMTDRVLADARAFDEYWLSALHLNAHELCHNWHGDLITCRDWSHAWLNEGAATYGEVEAVEHLLGKKERDYYLMNHAKAYFAEDKRYRRPVVCNTYREPIDVFDRHLYQGGALRRHMLRYLLGDADYYASVKTFLTDNAYQCVETLDFIKAIEKTTGKNVRKFFDQWLLVGAGYPEYKVTYSFDDKAKLATVKVQQTQKIEGDTGLFSMPVVLSFTLKDGSSKDFTVQVEDKEHSFTFALPARPVMFRFDPENWILKKVDLQVPKALLLYQVARDPEVSGRIYAAQALAKLGGLDVAATLEEGVRSDFFWGVSAECATALGEMGTPAACEALKRLYSVKHPKVRRAVVGALGKFKDESVAELLEGILSGGSEPSYFVLAEAALALGKTRSARAFAALEQALAQSSWNEVVRVGALNGLAELGDKRGIELAQRFAGGGQPWHARPAAIAALGRFAKKESDALDALHTLAEKEETGQFTLSMACIGALGAAGKPDSRTVLSRIATSHHDGRVKRAVAETLSELDEQGGNKGDDLKDKVEQLESQVKDLSERLERESARRARAPRKKSSS